MKPAPMKQAPPSTPALPSDAATESSAPLIETQALSWRVGGRDILDRIDLTVSPGEIVTLVGPNGAGKTTLARMVLGIVRPTSGRVLRRPGLRIGYLPQRLRINDTLPLTVARFLALAQRGASAVTHGVLAEVGAEGLRKRMLHELSGGELQRVLLARALARDPQLLVLDEPVQGVDVNGQMELYDRIAALREKRGCGVLLVSHDLHLVMSATTRVVCLNGHVCCSGHPDTVLRDPAYLGLFGERAAAGLALYAHHHDHRHDPPVTGPPVTEPGDAPEASGSTP